MFYNTKNGNTPQFLYDFIPQSVGERTNCSLRSAIDNSTPYYRLQQTRSSFYPAAIKLWNSLSSNLKNIDSNRSFKSE